MRDLEDLLVTTNEIYKINTELFGIDKQLDALFSFANFIFDKENFENDSSKFEKMKRLELNNNVLLVGKPGVGKTRSVFWLVKELKNRNKNFDFYSLSVGSILDENLGASSKIIENYFSMFREEANNSHGVIVLLDELDWLGVSRWKISENDGVRRAMSSLFMELDRNIAIPNLLFICSTNFVDYIDAALLRRFSKKIDFPSLMEFSSFKKFLSYIYFDYEFPDEKIKDLYQIVETRELTPSNIKDAFRNTFLNPNDNDEFTNLQFYLNHIDSTIERLNQSRKIFAKEVEK